MTDLASGSTRYSGARVQRVEDARLLTGRGSFVDDITRPGMLHACFVRSTVARARIGRVDTDEARAMRGVHAVFAASDLNPDVKELWYTGQGREGPTTPLPLLAEGEVRFVGDPVALIVADDRYLAEDAAELVVVDYEPLPAVVDYTTTGDHEGLVHDGYPGNVVGEMKGGRRADVDEVMDAAAHVVEHTIHQQAYAAVPLETRGIVASGTRRANSSRSGPQRKLRTRCDRCARACSVSRSTASG